MQLERVPVNPMRPLEPGRYFVEFEAPVAVLDGMAKAPNFGRAVISLMFDISGADVVYLGSGTTWTRHSGVLKRVFQVAFEVPDTPSVRVYYAAAPSLNAVLLLLGIAAATGGIVWSVWAIRDTLQSIPPEDLPGVIGDVRDTARATSSAIGWLVFGGLAVGGYLVAKREGWLS